MLVSSEPAKIDRWHGLYRVTFSGIDGKSVSHLVTPDAFFASVRAALDLLDGELDATTAKVLAFRRREG